MRRPPCTWTRRLSIVKMVILLEGLYRFNATHIKIPMQLFIEAGTTTLKFILKLKRPQKTKAVLTSKNMAGGIYFNKLFWKLFEEN